MPDDGGSEDGGPVIGVSVRCGSCRPFWRRCGTSGEPSELRVLAAVEHGGLGAASDAASESTVDTQVVGHKVLRHMEAAASLDTGLEDLAGASMDAVVPWAPKFVLASQPGSRAHRHRIAIRKMAWLRFSIPMTGEFDIARGGGRTFRCRGSSYNLGLRNHNHYCRSAVLDETLEAFSP